MSRAPDALQETRGGGPRHVRERGVAVAVLAWVGAGCAPRDSALEAVSPQAGDIAWLAWVVFVLGGIVYVAVMALVAVPLLRSWRRRGPTADADARDEAGGWLTGPPAALEDEPLAVAAHEEAPDAAADRRVRGRLIWWGGIILPAVILIALLLVGSLVSRSTAHLAGDDDLEIDVTGHMFWWEVEYPDLGVTTANEIHVPVDRPVRLNLHTEDVIHSFWIPRVHGKTDMIPGSDNILTFTVDEPGRYRGQCAEYCGIAHAQMAKFLVAEEPADFDAWVEAQRAGAAEPATEAARAGQEAFLEYGCAECHTVDGHGAAGTVGPDLTHLATRESLASGIVPNDREHLAELIVEPWTVKAGNPMPPTGIGDDDLEVLLDYLEGLE